MTRGNENENQGTGQVREKSRRGFAAMDPEQQRRIASKGGRAAHEQGVAHQFNSEEARIAGRKGGEVVSRDRQHMAEIGRKGGEASGGNRRSNANGSSNQNAEQKDSGGE